MHYNLTLFGDNVRKIREKLGFTRQYLSKRSGIHIETIRRIECGKNKVPKYETLEELSFYLKEDLNLLLINYRLDDYSSFTKIRYNIETKLDEGNLDLEKDIIQLKKLFKPESRNYYQTQIKQLIIFSEGISEYRNKRYEISYDKFSNSLKITTSDFNLDNFQTFHYSSMEIRILMNLALVLNMLGNQKSYLDIMEFCFDSTNRTEDMYCKLCHNLAGAYIRKGDYANALNVTLQGINYCEKSEKLNGLHVLYYGKGLAEYNLKKSDYVHSIKRALFLCDLFNKQDFKEKTILQSAMVKKSCYDFSSLSI